MDGEDAEDFRQFMAARSVALVRMAYLLTGDRGHAEDLVQSALIRAYRHWGKVRRSGVPEAYVRRILINERNSRWRAAVLALQVAPEQERFAGPVQDALDDAAGYLGRGVS